MKLIELSCDQASFKTIRFNPEGLTLIIGDNNKEEEGSSNGVGKTLSLGLIHHCLGASRINEKLKKAVPDWLFSLRFSLQGKEHNITRSGDGTKLFLNEKQIKLRELQSWLNECGVFYIDSNIPAITFRSLFSRFARYAKKDCLDPLLTENENEVDGIIRSLYLLGMDCTLAVAKKKARLEIKDIQKTKTTLKEDHILKDLFRAGTNPKVRLRWLEEEIPRLNSNLKQLQVAENYGILKWQENNLTKDLRETEKKIAVLDFQLDGISKSLEEQPDITASELLAFYKGLEKVFKPEMLEHFDKVEAFHNALTRNRKMRLEKDKLEIESRKEQLEREYKIKASKRDSLTQYLQGKKTLDEYAALAKQIASLEEEKNRLKSFIDLEATLNQRAQEIRERLVVDDRKTGEYLDKEPYADLSQRFSSLARMMYPNEASGIDIRSNDGDNQLRYNITVQIEGDDADGINSARILCFDWLFYMYGTNHTMNFLWHDNRMFAHIDPKARASWFSYVMEALSGTGKQYIAALNKENLDSMNDKEYMIPGAWDMLNRCISLTLKGDKPENKLLGIQFGS